MDLQFIIEGSEVDIAEKIRKVRSINEEVIRVIEEMKKAEVKVLRDDKWQIERELVLKEGNIYVIKNKELRVEIIWLHYDVLVAGYRERQKIIELVTRNYQWPRVTRDVGKYVDSCDIDQRIKNKIEVPKEKLKLSKVLEKPQIYLIVNFITKLLLVARRDTILVVCNRLFKIIHFVTIIEGTLAKGLVRLFRDNIWKLYGLPKSVVLDRGPQFVAEMTKELNKMLGIETKLLTSFYLQINR